MKIYLAGFMSGKLLKETTAWRIKIREHYMMKSWDIIWLDPYNGKDLATITGDGLKSSVPSQAIIHRDYMSVEQADVMIVNLNNFNSGRTSTGTICEIAWAWQMRKPIIMITDEAQYKEHPFTSYFASAFYPSVDAMLNDKIVDYFYQGINNAKYNTEDYQK